MTKVITVGELSRRTGVPAKALREYTDWGLIDTLGVMTSLADRTLWRSS